jgi:hypothetical protein
MKTYRGGDILRINLDARWWSASLNSKFRQPQSGVGRMEVRKSLPQQETEHRSRDRSARSLVTLLTELTNNTFNIQICLGRFIHAHLNVLLPHFISLKLIL